MDYDVVIVGAGAAGIGAARALVAQSCSVLMLEAGRRVGGRAWTQTLERMPLDMGCGWLHSADRNPLTGLAIEQGLAVDRRPAAWFAQYHDLGFRPGEYEAACDEWEAWHERLAAVASDSDRAADALLPGGSWASFIQAMSGYINGAELECLSIADYLAYDRASTDENWRIPSGYGHMIAQLLPATVPLRLQTPVTAIRTDAEGVQLSTPTGNVRARTAIITVSTHVLASGAIDLPAGLTGHVHAASVLPLGLANKFFLAIEGDAPFEEETHVLGNPHDPGTGSHYLRPFGRPLIETFLGGPGAQSLQDAGPEATFDFIIDEIAQLFGNAVRRHLRPLSGSQWGQEGWIGGSYSHALPGEAARRQELARPFEDRLFFAGEATHATHFSTAHGAYESGQRAAIEAMAALGAQRR